jgi:hypothetical protein
VVAIIATAIAVAVRNFARPAATQLRLTFDFYSIANDRHNTIQMALSPG